MAKIGKRQARRQLVKDGGGDESSSGSSSGEETSSVFSVEKRIISNPVSRHRRANDDNPFKGLKLPASSNAQAQRLPEPALKSELSPKEREAIANLKALNTSFLNAVEESCKLDHFIDLSSLFEQYKEHRKRLDAKFEYSRSLSLLPSKQLSLGFTADSTSDTTNSEDAKPFKAPKVRPVSVDLPAFAVKPNPPTPTLVEDSASAKPTGFTFPASRFPNNPQQLEFTFPSNPQQLEFTFPSNPQQPEFTFPNNPQQPESTFPNNPQQPESTFPSQPQQPEIKFPSSPQQPEFKFPSSPQSQKLSEPFAPFKAESAAPFKASKGEPTKFSFPSLPSLPAFGENTSTKPLFTFADATRTDNDNEDDDSVPVGEEESFSNTRTNLELLKRGAGEEDDHELFPPLRSKLFIYDTAASAWTDLGIGLLKVNQSTKPGSKARLLCRAEGSGRILLNGYLDPQVVKLSFEEGKRDLTVTCFNQDARLAKYLVRTKESAQAAELYSLLSELIK